MARGTAAKASVAGNLVVLVFGVLAALVIAEIMLRLWAPQMTGPIQFVFDPVLGPIPVPGQSARRTLPGVYSYAYTNDSHGLRIVPGSAGGNPGPRVLLLGDSFTYGIGVDDTATYAAQLQEALPQVTIVNGGVGGKGTDYALKFVQTRATTNRPLITVLAFFRNDFCDNGRGDYFTLRTNGQLLPRPLRVPSSTRHRS